MIFGWFRNRANEDAAAATYAGIVGAARQPRLFSEIGVPDTLAGRYEVLVIHLFLFLYRLKDESDDIRRHSQRVFDLMFRDLDRSLREMGVGDLSVPKRIKKLASAFYGRTAAYDAALTSGDRVGLEVAVLRNVFGGDVAQASEARRLAAYMLASCETLKAQPVAEVAHQPCFADVSAMSEGTVDA